MIKFKEIGILSRIPLNSFGEFLNPIAFIFNKIFINNLKMFYLD